MKLLRTSKLILSLFALSGFIAVGGWFTSGVAHAADTYPNSPSVADVAIQGPNSAIQAPVSWFEVTTRPSFGGSLTVTIHYVCATAGNPGLSATVQKLSGATMVSGSTPNGACSSADVANNTVKNLTLNGINMGGVGTDPKYDNQLKTVKLKVTKTLGQGHQPFTAEVSGDSSAAVSYQEDPYRSDSGVFETSNPFAIWINGDSNFKFQPDCNYDGQPIYLKWSDADAGTSYQSTSIATELDEYYAKTENGHTRGQLHAVKWSSSGTALGTTNNQKVHSPGLTLSGNYYYIWRWKNVSGVNAMQLLVPFSENAFKSSVSCNQAPEGNISKVTCSAITLRGYDPDDPNQMTNFRVRRINSSGSGTTTVLTNQSNKNYKTYSVNLSSAYDIYNPIRFILEVQDVNDGTWHKVNGTTGQPFSNNCAVDTPCLIYNKAGGLGAHSLYRFTFFAKDQNYITSTPSPTTVGNGAWSSGGYPRWANFNATPVYQSPIINSNSQSTYTHTYPAPSGPDWLVYIERWDHSAGSSYTYTYGHAVEDNCYSAKCTISFVGNVPGKPNGVQDGQPFTVNATMQNTGRMALPDSIAGSNLSLVGTGDWSFAQNVGYPIDKGDTATDPPFTPFSLTADASKSLLKAKPTYNNRFDLGSDCDTTTTNGSGPKTYVPFALTLSASVNATPSSENPSSISYSTGASNSASRAVNVQTTSKFYKKSASGAVTNIDAPPSRTDAYETHSYFSGTYNSTPANMSAGDQFCSNILTPFTTGWVGPDGPDDLAGTGNPGNVTSSPCTLIINEPYAHFFNSNVWAGGGFDGGSCSATGGIYTYNSGGGVTPVGSGSQFAALAIGQIQGLSSANLRSSSPASPLGLTFSNTDNTSGGASPAFNLGGDLGGARCVTDYYAKKPSALTPNASPLISSVGTLDGAAYYQPGGGTLTLGGGNIGDGKRIALYVDGNVYINGSSISFSNTSWSNTKDIPSFYLIVHGGNIYVSKSISQLDGVYIAQPDQNGNGGDIYTCAQINGPYVGSALFNNCNKQLVINGAFVDKTTHLERTFSSLRYGHNGEYPSFGTARSCGPDSGNSSNDDCAAEIFNFTPEIYLAQPSIPPSSGPTFNTYDYFTSLSPIL